MLLATPISPPVVAPKCLYNGLGAAGLPAVSILQSFVNQLKAAPSVEYVNGTPADTRIHQPEFEMEPWGKFSIEITQSESDVIENAINEIVAAIAAQLGSGNTRRILVDNDAKPPPPANGPRISDFIRKAENLIGVYQTRSQYKRVSKLSGPIIAGGLFLGLAVVSAVAYSKWNEGR